MRLICIYSSGADFSLLPPPLFFSFSNDGTKGTYALICEMAQPLKGLAFKPDDLSLIPGPTR